jgi:hypothetical protein
MLLVSDIHIFLSLPLNISSFPHYNLSTFILVSNACVAYLIMVVGGGWGVASRVSSSEGLPKRVRYVVEEETGDARSLLPGTGREGLREEPLPAQRIGRRPLAGWRIAGLSKHQQRGRGYGGDGV